ncbi:hypothetical protein HDU77_009811 [Chytriomyces hyalinus]|nr:hypothetical protein HDU77_009811 [Chytriomyces hyalinus]
MSSSTEAPQPNTRLFPFLPPPAVTATSTAAGGLFNGFLNPLTSTAASAGSSSSSTRIPSTSTTTRTLTSTSSILPPSTLPQEAFTAATASAPTSNTIEVAQPDTIQPAVIAGIAVGSVAFVALLVLAVLCWCKRRKSAASNYAQLGRRSIGSQPSNDAETNNPASNPLLTQPYHHQNPGAQISRGIENAPSPHPATPISKISPTESELISLRASWNLPKFDSTVLAAQSTTEAGQTAPPFNISNWILHRKATATTETRIVTSPIVIERIIKTRVTPEGSVLYFVQYLDHPTLQEEWISEDAIPAHELETFRNMNDNAIARRENLARSGSYGAGAFSQDEGVVISMDRVRGAGVVNVSNGTDDSAASVWFRPNVASILSGKTVSSGSDVGSRVSVVQDDSHHV